MTTHLTKPKIQIIDARYGNTFSVRHALARAGAAVVEHAPDADAFVLPGVGAFDAAASGLGPARQALATGKPFLGICLGMQLLFESSEEGTEKGLGVLDGRVRKLAAPRLPHLGWNTVRFGPQSRLGAGLQDEWFYFVHSFACPGVLGNGVRAYVRGVTDYGGPFCSVVEAGLGKDRAQNPNVFGVQFHPEKSGMAGQRLLENFVEVVRRWK